ncbi:hypothetical protein [Sulfitobacter sp. 1A15106]|uniref:hypothetical protein n=1 Tax=Sulfitobacter sp. 1A15106 TaxID=3368590 RepID=UPI003744C7D3
MPRYQVSPDRNEVVVQRVSGGGASIVRETYRSGDIFTIDAVDAAQLLADGEVIAYGGADPDSTPYRTTTRPNPAAGSTDPLVLPADAPGVLLNNGSGVLTWSVVAAGGSTPSFDVGNDITVGFDGGLYFSESVTALSMVGTNLRYFDENGILTNIDLAPYANNPRVVSAALNGATGIATFTRDDGSTFALDLSGLTGAATAPSADPGNAITLGSDNLLYSAGATLSGVVSPASDDPAGAVGTAAEAARSDHKHPAQAPSADAGNTITVGSDGLHYSSGGAGSPATNVSPAADDATGAVGVSTASAREDHKHPAQGVSADANNSLTVGSDGLHHFEEAVTNLWLDMFSLDLRFTDETGVTKNIPMLMQGGTSPFPRGGLVPEPPFGEGTFLLQSDGTWVDPAATAGTPARAFVEIPAMGSRNMNYYVNWFGTPAEVDVTSSIDQSSGKFTAPNDGLYDIEVSAAILQDPMGTTSDAIYFNFRVNSGVALASPPTDVVGAATDTNSVVMRHRAVLELNAGDEFRFQVAGVTGAHVHNGGTLTVIEL